MQELNHCHYSNGPRSDKITKALESLTYNNILEDIRIVVRSGSCHLPGPGESRTRQEFDFEIMRDRVSTQYLLICSQIVRQVTLELLNSTAHYAFPKSNQNMFDRQKEITLQLII